MQDHNYSYPDPSAGSPGAHDSGATATAADTTEPYVHPTIPLGLPHVVQFVEASMHHLPMSVRFVGDRMSRYANAKGEVSIAIPFICQITGLGSKNTAEHHIRLMESMGVLEKRSGKGGKDRKSNTYIFLGEQRSWKPLPTERPGTDPWIALAQARRENEELREEIARLRESMAIGHSGVTDGKEAELPEPLSDSYETAVSGPSAGVHGAIGHSGVTDGKEAELPEPLSDSYETAVSGPSAGVHGAIGHSGVTDGKEAELPEPLSDSYETAVSGPSAGVHGAIGHSGVTDGSEDAHPDESSRSYEGTASEPPPQPQDPTGHSVVTNGEDEGQEYLARRERVQALVMEQRNYYNRSFRGGLLSAIEFFSRNDENEADLVRQVNVLKAGQEPADSGSDPPEEAEAPSVPLTASGRREVEYCPDCGSPYTTFNDEVLCPDCTYRQREGEA